MDVWQALLPPERKRDVPDTRTVDTVRRALGMSLAKLKILDEGLVESILQVTGSSRVDVESAAKALVRSRVKPEYVASVLRQRAELIAEQVRAYWPQRKWESVLDVGCGDGLVSFLLKDCAVRWTLCDTEAYLDPCVSLPFIELVESAPLPFKDSSFEASLLLTVLHHATSPLELLRETLRVTADACVVIESVVGEPERMPNDTVGLAGLSESQQWTYAAFVDWFYNRVLHDDVPVPCNFATPSEWANRFRGFGWAIDKQIDLGIDQELVPEHHVLFVIKRA